MSNRAQITRQLTHGGVPVPTVEQDYVLAHVMAALGVLGGSHVLVFKGGMAPKLCYFKDSGICGSRAQGIRLLLSAEPGIR